MSKKIAVAVIGVGYWGKKVASEYASLCEKESDVRFIGVCDVFDSNLKFCAEKYNLPLLATNPTDILANPEIDAVHVCTPSETHYDICKEALLNGKHVTLEKPMTLNSLEAIKLVDLAHEKNLVLSVGHIFRFDAAVEKTKELIESGWFGDLYWIKLTWVAFMPPMVGRDIITDLAPHPFDILNFLTNDWPTKLTCVAKAHRAHQKEETAYITCEFKNNMIAHIEVSWLNPEKTREIQIMGSQRFAKIDCINQTIKAYENDHFFDVPVDKSNTINRELSHFIQCIREGQTSNDVVLNKNNGLVGTNVVRMLEIAKRAMESRATVQVI
jgi:UDP-N-acetylglucosamine 3-dehydrogenase